jgi:4-hydroxybenzoate polyprenyltransferase
LIANATWIGAAASQPYHQAWTCVSGTWKTALICGSWAALYLEANYEKDRRGDAVAGYTTLPHVVGIRLSAVTRALGALGIAAFAWHALTDPLGRATFAVATLLLLISTAPSLIENSEHAALRGYRFAVHAANLGLLALGLPVLTAVPGLILMLASATLTESAFRRSPNP